MTRKSAAGARGRIGVITGALQVCLWLLILLFAFVMQVVPFLLVLTMFNLAVGITSGMALIVIPVAAFVMLSVACWIATRRMRRALPEPLPQPGYMAPYNAGSGTTAAPSTRERLVPILQRWRWRSY